MNSYLSVPSVIYKERINNFCNQLKDISEIQNIAIYLNFNNNSRFILSNTPDNFLKLYWEQKLHRYDRSANEETISAIDHYVCSDNKGVDLKLKSIMENQFNMYRAYYAVRRAPECTFVFGVLNNRQIGFPESFYKHTIEKVENFTFHFIHEFIDIIKAHNAVFRNAIIFNDKQYLKNVIKNKIPYRQVLTKREIECLFWVSQGKSSEEIALILSLKKSTIDFYKQNLKEKLNCSNMAHCVYEGILRGHIGSFNNVIRG